MACPAATGAEAGRDGLNQSPIDGSRNVSQHHRAMVIDPSSMRRMGGLASRFERRGAPRRARRGWMDPRVRDANFSLDQNREV
jgi:hypothetical protein